MFRSATLLLCLVISINGGLIENVNLGSIKNLTTSLSERAEDLNLSSQQETVESSSGDRTLSNSNNQQNLETQDSWNNNSTSSKKDEQNKTQKPITDNVTERGGKPEEEEENEKEVCFGNLGCFQLGKPWKSLLRPISAPMSPVEINTTLFFYSRQNLREQKNITLYPQINMGAAQFDPSKITVIVVHGFASSGSATWMSDMKNAYLKHIDANVVLVDWGKGAQGLNYLQVAGNTRVVGKQLSIFVKYLQENYGASPSKFHLIGHSLGAHICSYLAKDVPGIARLTALDPAQPGFEGFAKEVRLDKSDANFVDVVHTDAKPFLPTLGFGMITPQGHVDFYMNGGFEQPGCIIIPKEDLPKITSLSDLAKFPVEVLREIVSCSHGRAYEFLTEALNETDKCIFWGHKAHARNIFKSVANSLSQGFLEKLVSLSPTCSKDDCVPLGFATKKSPLRGIFVVTTSAKEPYCISEPGVPPETNGTETQHSLISRENLSRLFGFVKDKLYL